MNSAVKLFIGLLIFVAGLYWYTAQFVGLPGGQTLLRNTLSSLKTVFMGVFGLFLIMLGTIVTWIEYEDLKWEAREKHERARNVSRRRK